MGPRGAGGAQAKRHRHSVDGGVLMTNSQIGEGGALVFGDNDLKNYAGLCTINMVLKNGTAGGVSLAGFTSTGYGYTGANSNSIAMIEFGAAVTYSSLTATIADGTWGRVYTNIPSGDTNWHNVKIDIESASINLSVDGVLEATQGATPYRSGNPRVQPAFNGIKISANATTYMRYCEAYNR